MKLVRETCSDFFCNASSFNLFYSKINPIITQFTKSINKNFTLYLLTFFVTNTAAYVM